MDRPRINDQYFASLPITDFIQEAHGRVGDYYDFLRESGLFYLWEKSYRAYFGARLTGSKYSGQLFDSSEIRQGGKAGEIAHLKINHYRSLLKHTLQLATATKPAYACRATNGDYKSQTQAILGNGLVDYYLREKKLTGILTHAVENSLVFSEGWVHDPWDATHGEKYGVHPDTGAVIYEGDLRFSVHTPLDVVRDTEQSDTDNHEWLMVRTFVNRWELAAKFPAVAEQILAINPGSYQYENGETFNIRVRESQANSELVTMWTFYHKKSDAMENGRLVQFVGDVMLVDGPIPYRRIPLHCVRPDKLIGTSFGYSPAFDVLGPQQGLDILNSTIMTNNANNGVQSIWTKAGDPVTVTQLQGGMKNLQSEEMPQPIQLTKTAPETFQFRQELIGEMETIIGISATVRGNPEANLKSGSALALVVSQSIQFASLLEASYNALVEDVGTDIIVQLRDFSKTRRVANILGESNRPFRKEFSGDDLDSINRVVVEATSPLSKTISGRIEMASDLLEKGFIETAKQYIMVLTTGQLDPAIEGAQHELLNIRAENEDMRDGKPVQAIVTDIHADHIKEHRSLLSNPEARKNPQFLRLVLKHIDDHLFQWRNADPAVLMITGQEPPPPPPPPAGMPPPPGAPVGPGQPGGQPGPGPAAGGPQPAPGQIPELMSRQKPTDAQQPAMPNMPSLPNEAPESAKAAFEKIA